MQKSSIWLTSIPAALLTTIVAFPLAFGQAEGAKLMPKPEKVLTQDSPLAMINGKVFGIGTDRTIITARDIRGGPWIPLTVSHKFSSLVTLTSDSQSLYVSEAPNARIYRVSISSGNAELLHEGPPLTHPTSMSLVGDALFVADESGSIYAFKNDYRTPELLNLGAKSLSRSHHIHLHGSGQHLFVTDPESGLMIDVGYPTIADKSVITEYVCGPTPCSQEMPSRSPESPPDVLPSLDRIESIRHPGSLTTSSGIIYVVDEKLRQIFATSKHQIRPVRLYSWDYPVSTPSEIQVTPDSLVILDSATQNITVWPLLIPTEVVVDVKTSESLSAIYNYLYKHGILPTRAATLHGSIEKTLRDEGVLLSPYVPTLDPVTCGLNRSICKNGKPRTRLPSGLRIVVPDLYSETFVDARVITLDGTRNLRDEVDKRITSPQLKDWGSELHLVQLNSQLATKGNTKIDKIKTGSYIVPVELVRYVIAMPASDVFGATPALLAIQNKFKADLSLRPLKDVQATPQQQDSSSHSIREYQDSFAQLLKTVNYVHPANVIVSSYVGVAEDNIDCDGPDFGSDVCSELGTSLASTPQAMPTTAIASSNLIRPFDLTDHGTAVAGLIGARTILVDKQGLAAPEATIVPLRTTDKELADDIRAAYLRNTRIFNLSLSFDRGTPSSLSDIVGTKGRHSQAYSAALFIVAAPDDGRSSCGAAVERYPICWGSQDNVIAVAGTTIDGSALIPSRGGSSWGKEYVQIAAPGMGFAAPGRNHSYVPVIGSSFAAPLVSATAALLYEEGVQTPLLIKQRIIATSTPIPAYEANVSGGLLNVKRAVTNIGRAVLIDGFGQESVVELKNETRISLFWPGGEIELPVRNLLRLIRTDDDYLAIYQDPQDGRLRVQPQGVRPPDGRTWKIPVKTATPSGLPGPITTRDLAECSDYFGPIMR